MAFGTRVAFDEIRELSFGSITGTFSALGPPTSDHVRVITFQNTTNEDVYISFDGIKINLRVPTNSFKLFDFSANKVKDDGLFLASGTQIFIKFVGPLGTVGTFWTEMVSAEGGK